MSLRARTTTKLRAALAAFEFAERRLRADAALWPASDIDMTPHEVDEACARIVGIKANVRAALNELETKPLAKATA